MRGSRRVELSVTKIQLLIKIFQKRLKTSTSKSSRGLTCYVGSLTKINAIVNPTPISTASEMVSSTYGYLMELSSQKKPRRKGGIPPLYETITGTPTEMERHVILYFELFEFMITNILNLIIKYFPNWKCHSF